MVCGAHPTRFSSLGLFERLLDSVVGGFGGVVLVEEAAVVAIEQTIAFLEGNDTIESVVFACSSTAVVKALEAAYRSVS